MAYHPYKQGRKDGLAGKARRVHRSAWNQLVYDDAYNAASKERDARIVEERAELERADAIREAMEEESRAV